MTGLVKTEADITICGLELNKENIYDIRKNIGVIFDNLDNTFISETIEDDLAFTSKFVLYKRRNER